MTASRFGSFTAIAPFILHMRNKVKLWVKTCPRSTPVSAVSAILQSTLTDFHAATRHSLIRA